MVDIGVALTWIAFSAVSVKGLSAFARAAATTGGEAELALPGEDDACGREVAWPLDAPFRLLHERA